MQYYPEGLCGVKLCTNHCSSWTSFERRGALESLESLALSRSHPNASKLKSKVKSFCQDAAERYWKQHCGFSALRERCRKRGRRICSRCGKLRMFAKSCRIQLSLADMQPSSRIVRIKSFPQRLSQAMMIRTTLTHIGVTPLLQSHCIKALETR